MNYPQILAECEKYFQDNPDALNRIERIKANRQEDKFEVVFAGGVSRGKSRLLNAMLDTDILPESTLPTTTMLTEISYGQVPRIELQTEMGNQILPAAKGSLERFNSDEPEADKAGIIHIEWPAEFLKPSLALYDTPGIDDIFSNRANIVYELLERAEGTVVVISATNPMSILEHNFIETYLKGHAIPRIAIVISFLDQVAEKDVAKSVQFIINKARRIDPGLEIWAAQDMEAATRGCAVCGPKAIAERLRQWSDDPGLETRRDKRDARLLTGLIKNSIAQQSKLLSIVEQQNMEGQQSLLAAFERLDHQKEDWEELRKKFLDKSEAARVAVLDDLNGFKQYLLDCLSKEKPEDFNYSLRSRLSDQTGKLSDKIRARVWGDAAAFQKDIAAKFNLPETMDLMPTQKLGLAYSVPVLARDGNGGVVGVLLQFARKLWSDAGEILPIPGGYYKNIYMMGKSMLDKLNQQYGGSDDFVQETTGIVNAFFNELQLQIKMAIDSLYAETADHISEEQSRWLQDQRSTLMETHTPAQLNEKIDNYRKSMAAGKEILASMEE